MIGVSDGDAAVVVLEDCDCNCEVVVGGSLDVTGTVITGMESKIGRSVGLPRRILMRVVAKVVAIVVCVASKLLQCLSVYVKISTQWRAKQTIRHKHP